MPEFDQEQGYRDGEEEKYCKLFIGGLNYTTTEEGLRGHFEQWGEIVDCVVMRDPVTKRSRGFGFVTYKTEEMLDDAQKNRPHKLDGREVDTKRAIPRNESDETQATVKKMFVGGLKDGTTEEEIKTKFETFGTIDKVEMIKDKNTGKQRGFCFVTYDDYDAVDKCVLRRRIQLKGKYVEVKKAVSKNEIERAGRGGMSRGDFGRSRNNFDDFGGGGNWNMGGGGSWGNSGYGGNQGGNWNQGNQGGWNQGYGGGGSGGYGGGNFNQRGNFGGYNQGNNFGGGGDYGGNENAPAGETTADSPHHDKLSPTEYAYDGNWGNQNFGSGYGGSGGGNLGAMRGGNYAQRSGGPYGGGYGMSGGGGSSGGGGGGGYSRR